MWLLANVGVPLVCVLVVFRGVIVEALRVRRRAKCPHERKVLVLRSYAGRFDQYHCEDCGQDTFECLVIKNMTDSTDGED